MTAKHQEVPVFKDHAALDMYVAILEHANYFGPSVEMEVVEVAGVVEEGAVVVVMDSDLCNVLNLFQLMIVPNIFFLYVSE